MYMYAYVCTYTYTSKYLCMCKPICKYTWACICLVFLCNYICSSMEYNVMNDDDFIQLFRVLIRVLTNMMTLSLYQVNDKLV